MASGDAIPADVPRYKLESLEELSIRDCHDTGATISSPPKLYCKLFAQLPAHLDRVDLQQALPTSNMLYELLNAPASCLDYPIYRSIASLDLRGTYRKSTTFFGIELTSRRRDLRYLAGWLANTDVKELRCHLDSFLCPMLAGHCRFDFTPFADLTEAQLTVLIEGLVAMPKPRESLTSSLGRTAKLHIDLSKCESLTIPLLLKLLSKLPVSLVPELQLPRIANAEKELDQYIQSQFPPKGYDRILQARCYLHGWAVKKKSAKALGMLRKLETEGSALAQYWLAECCRQGWGVPRSAERAAKVLSKPLQPLNEPACFNPFGETERVLFKFSDKKKEEVPVPLSKIDPPRLKTREETLLEWARGCLNYKLEAPVLYDSPGRPNKANMPTKPRRTVRVKPEKRKQLQQMLQTLRAKDKLAGRVPDPRPAFAQVNLLAYGRVFNALTAMVEGKNPPAEAHYLLGRCYLAGWGTEVNRSEAIKHLRLATNEEWPAATFYLGLVYFYGWGIEPQPKEGFRLIEQAAHQGCNEAAMQLALSYALGWECVQDEKKAASFLTGYLEKHKPVAAKLHTLQGISLINGWSGEKDPSAAYVHFSEGKSDPYSGSKKWGTLWHARALLNGWGCEPNEKQAFEDFQLLSMCGYSKSYIWTGLCHLNGWGCEPNHGNAISYFTRAREAADEDGTYYYAICALNGFGLSEPKEKEAFTLFSTLAAAGHLGALRRQGECLWHGWGTEADSNKGRSLVWRAASQGDGTASMILAEEAYALYLNHITNAADTGHQEAIKLLEGETKPSA